MLGDQSLIAFVATSKSFEALSFYRDVLGLDLVENSPFALVFEASGRMLRIQKVDQVRPPSHTVLGWGVADIKATVGGLRDRGVTFRLDPRLDQDDQGIWTTPDGHKVAWFQDPDGYNLSVTEFAAHPSA